MPTHTYQCQIMEIDTKSRKEIDRTIMRIDATHMDGSTGVDRWLDSVDRWVEIVDRWVDSVDRSKPRGATAVIPVEGVGRGAVGRIAVLRRRAAVGVRVDGVGRRVDSVDRGIKGGVDGLSTRVHSGRAMAASETRQWVGVEGPETYPGPCTAS